MVSIFSSEQKKVEWLSCDWNLKKGMLMISYVEKKKSGDKNIRRKGNKKCISGFLFCLFNNYSVPPLIFFGKGTYEISTNKISILPSRLPAWSEDCVTGLCSTFWTVEHLTQSTNLSVNPSPKHFSIREAKTQYDIKGIYNSELSKMHFLQTRVL